MKLVLIEDNPADARLICEMLKESRAGDFQVQQPTRLDAALELLRRDTFDVVLLDLSLPDSHGLETLARAQRVSASLPILVLTGLDDERFALEAVRAGAQDYLVKGQFGAELLVRAIRYAIQRKRAEEEIRRLNAVLETRVAERTEQLQRAKQVAETNMAQMRTTLDNLAEAVYVCDAEGIPLLTNPAFQRLTGDDASALRQKYEDVAVQFPLFELDGRRAELAEWPISAALRGEIVRGRELRLERQPSGDRILRFNAAPVRDAEGNIIMAVVSIEDITASKQAEAALIRSEKLAAVGRMAGTISHEVNNPLAAATNALFLASSDPSLAPETRSHLILADQELRRAAHIARQTLGFFRENTRSTPVVLPKLIDEVVAIYARKLKERGITIHCRYKCGPCRQGCETCFLVNAGEMRQIISNLLANGIDALADNGRLHIRVARLSSVPKRGAVIQITIADNGCGIRPENLKRVFEPFFTTKQSVGTGLGLWITEELVRKHNGSIKVRSRNEKGTVFRIIIPAMSVADSNAGKNSECATDAKASPQPLWA